LRDRLAVVEGGKPTRETGTAPDAARANGALPSAPDGDSASGAAAG
jgi:hypothetical protein